MGCLKWDVTVQAHIFAGKSRHNCSLGTDLVEPLAESRQPLFHRAFLFMLFLKQLLLRGSPIMLC